ncbi:hypothetical protein [Streptomyces sp. NPDC001601]|uniref:hypothetical protein n=1 Tax=Streptomyces sp. NPDC001601 TaxID=3364592 RepID=UPI00367FA756
MTPKITSGMPFADLARKDAAARASAPAAPRPRPTHEYDPLRVSALAYQHLGADSIPLDAAYQMISCIQRLLSDDDFTRIRAFAEAAFHPDHASEAEPYVQTRMRWSRALDKHLGEQRLSTGLQTAHIMLHCIKDLLTPGEMRQFLTFVDAAYSIPDVEAAAC